MINSREWGKFTARGSQKVEVLITKMVEEIVSVVEDTVPEKDIKCLYMLGGYGRGEGGVVIINGQERPHNNFDLMLVTGEMRADKANDLKQKIDANLQQLIERIGIGIDTSLITANKLKGAACRVIWYDMKFGHKLLTGSSDIINTCNQFKLKNIPAWDARNLLVNRGTLLIINDMLLDRKELTPELKKVIIKHIIKCIIGYGDSLLFFLGDYNWSYIEKQKRMQQRGDVRAEFKKLYDDAMNFRFQPDYEPYLKLDLKEWLPQVLQYLQEVNLYCEQRRLHKKKLNWENYIYHALAHGITEGGLGIKGWGKRFLNYSSMDTEFPGKAPLRVKLGYKFLGERGILPIIYPLIAYKFKYKEFRRIARGFLKVKTFSYEDLRTAYLNKWGDVLDTNFHNLLNKYNINIKKGSW